MQQLRRLSSQLKIYPWDIAAAHQYGEIRQHLESQGSPIGGNDTMIAAHALSQQATLVTNNLREFARVPNLPTVNWVE